MGVFPCRTRNVSEQGVFLETPITAEPGAPIEVSLLDRARGEAISVLGQVKRCVPPSAGGGAGLAIHIPNPPAEWLSFIDRVSAEIKKGAGTQAPQRRIRVLVVGDPERQRGALALYVTSGWNVRFASDLPAASEALGEFKIDAIVVEHDLDDPRWPPILEAAKAKQPSSVRIVRSHLRGKEAPPQGMPGDLVHHVVDQDAGLDALIAVLARH